MSDSLPAPRWWALLSLALIACVEKTPERTEAQRSAPAHAPSETTSLSPPEGLPPDGEAAARFRITFPAPHTHMMEIEATYHTSGADPLILMMAVWTPGSYLVREYARHVEGVVVVTDEGAEAPTEKLSKNRWAIPSGGAEQVTVRYRVYGREMSVRTNWIDQDMAVLNGAPTFLVPADELSAPLDIDIRRARSWPHLSTALPATAPADADGTHHLRAADYDTLVDSPILLGALDVRAFQEGGRQHELVNVGGSGVWDLDRSAVDVAKIVRAQQSFWRDIPYTRYRFLNVLSEARGGLEHKHSTLMMTSQWATHRREAYLSWLRLVSHEYFHAWNVKRLRPRALGPFDYEREVHTESLWIAEGITAYYDSLFVRRAGLCTVDEYLKRLSRSIERVQGAPGRLVRSLARASFDAWIRYYRGDENSINSDISYYRKGALVAWLLDVKIRRESRGQKSLDDVMRLAWRRFSASEGFTPPEFVQTIQDATGVDASGLLRSAVETTEELNYLPALAYFGLTLPGLHPEEQAREQGDGPPTDPPAGWLGVQTRESHGRLLITRVVRGTPAWSAGVNVDDELLAIGTHRVPVEGWDTLRARFRPGAQAELLISRRGELQRLPVTFDREPDPKAWQLRQLRRPTSAQRAALLRWLGPQ